MLRNHLAAKSAARGKSVLSSPKNSLSSGSNRSAFSRSTEYRSFIEPLEARQLLSATVIEVTTTQDIVDPNDAFISLREAILAANASPEDNEIVLSAGTYTLTRQGANEDAGLTGDLDIKANGSLRIVGSPTVSSMIDASGLMVAGLGYGDRIFDVLDGSNVEVIGVSLTKGAAPTSGPLLANQSGGAVRVTNATFSLVRSEVSSNAATRGGGIALLGSTSATLADSFIYFNPSSIGGGIYNAGQLVGDNLEFIGNSAEAGRGGGIASDGQLTLRNSRLGSNSSGLGGAVHNAGTALIESSTLSGNRATLDGGAIYSTGTMTVVETGFNSNRAQSSGGAVFNSNQATMSITSSEVVNNAATSLSGGAVLNAGQMTLASSFVSSNDAGWSGGAIYNKGFGQLTVVEARITGNVAMLSGGGGIVTDSEAVLRVEKSRIDDNRAQASSDGGGILALGRVVISESTISGNSAQGSGGGISSRRSLEIVGSTVFGNRSSGNGGGISASISARIRNSTISENQAELLGGGVYGSGLLDIVHSTLTGNRVSAPGEQPRGGGLYISGSAQGTFASLDHTIVAGNLRGPDPTSAGDDIVSGSVQVATIAGRFSLVGSPATAGGLVHGLNGNIVGNGSGGNLDINTVLNTTLANNGGPTLTHALLITSPAINAGDPAFDPNTFDPPLDFDQRGPTFPRVIGGRVDFGAIETADPLPVGGLIRVTTFDDIVAVDGLWSLREAVLWANAHPEDNEIVLSAGTYTLTRQGWNEDAALTGDLDIVSNGSLRIVGAGQASTTIDASSLYNSQLGYGDRIFYVLPEAEVFLENVTLTGGDTESNPDQNRSGGAIRNEGLLSVLSSTLSDNRGGSGGGAISNAGYGELTIANSILSGNWSTLNGGAIDNVNYGTVEIYDSVLSANEADLSGGAVNSTGTLSITRSSLRDNSARDGGGLWASRLTLVDSLFEANSATRNGGGLWAAGTISGSTFQGNTAENGGAIYAAVSIDASQFFENVATKQGGAIHSSANLQLRGSTLGRNVAAQGGAVALLGASGGNSWLIEGSQIYDNQATHGGGIYASAGTLSRVRIADSVISGNAAVEYGGGADLQGNGFWIEIDDTNFTDNSADRGGGVSVSSANFIMSGGSIRDNKAAHGAGAFLADFPAIPPFGQPTERRSVLTGVDISGNVASEIGGGIRADYGHVLVIGGSITNNSAQSGGAVYASGFDSGGQSLCDVTLERVMISGNTATQNGGALANSGSELILKSSTLTGNHADGLGGAVHAGFRSQIVNSTITGNTANLDGGGIYAGSIYGSIAALTIRNSTVVLNRADAEGNGAGSGGGLAVGTFGTVRLENSIIAGNVTDAEGADVAGDISLPAGILDAASSYNLIGDPATAGGLSSGVNGNIVGNGLGGVLDVSTVLNTALANSGGPTLTHALLAGSPAVNAGNPEFNPNETPFDQRGAGYARVSGGRVDIGAFEFGSEFAAAVSGRQVFYNNSSYDAQDSKIGLLDQFAIDPTKQALRPNDTLADAANITSYSRGINGIMVDLAGSHPNLTLDDFIFRVGANNDPASWAAAPSPSAIQVLKGHGVGGGDRVVITWPDGAILNTYLQVIALANEDTGLDEPDMFFFGNRVGDTFNTQPAGSFTTTAADELAARSASPKVNLAISNPYDFDKSGTLTAVDQLISRANVGVLRRIQIGLPVDASPLAVPAVGQSIAALSAASVSSSATNTLVSGLATRASSSATDFPQDAAAAGTLQQQASPAVRPSATALFAAVDKVFGAPSASGSSESAGTLDDLLDELIPALA